MYNIVTFDGGGVRGILSAILYKRMAQKHPTFFNQVDLYSGTSTGAILACGIACGLPTESIISLYKDRSKFIFTKSFWEKIKSPLSLFSSRYNNNRDVVFTEIFGKKLLSQIPSKIVIPTFCISPEDRKNWDSVFYHNFKLTSSGMFNPRYDSLITEVLMKTSAAPTYFPVYKGYIDGGVVANNPSMCALSQALNKHTGKSNLEDIRLVSFGTGYKPKVLNSNVKSSTDWGFLEWGTGLIDILFDGPATSTNYQIQEILGNNYCRVDCLLPEVVGLDEWKKIDKLIEIAETVKLPDTLFSE